MSLPRDRLHAITLSGIRDGFACSGVYLELEFSLSAIVRRFYHKYLKTQYISFTIPLDSSYQPLLQEDFTLSGVAAASVGKCAVSSLAQNITFFPGVWRVRNAWKITAWIEANWRRFLATLL